MLLLFFILFEFLIFILGKVKVAEVLIRNGANMEIETDYPITAICLANQQGNCCINISNWRAAHSHTLKMKKNRISISLDE